MDNLIDNYINDLKNNPDFIRLLELKKLIDAKYSTLIVSFKNKEALYLEAKENSNYYSNFEEIKQAFIIAKSTLFSKEEVKEYFTLERKIQKLLNDDINDLKSSISNKFIQTNFLNI